MVQFQDYDRITDTILYLSNDITLNFTVALSGKSKDGSRQFYHYETVYTSKYVGSQSGRAIKRNMRYYFTIDNKKDFGNGLILRPQDVAILLSIIENQFLPLFFSDKRVFKIINDRLTLFGKIKPVIYTQSQYKYLSLNPVVNQYEDGTFKEGVRFECNREYIDMDIDKFMGFYYILKNTDMYGAACTLTTYVKTQPYEINVWSQQPGLAGGGRPPEFEPANEIAIGKRNSFLDKAKERK